MPIRPEQRELYPANWPWISLWVRFTRAGWRCERCGAVPHEPKVRLATAHLDQDPGNNDPANLAALCQRCHLDHDRPFNRVKYRLTIRARHAMARARLAVRDLFEGV